RQQLNKVIALLQQKVGPGGPDLEIPAAKTRKLQGATLYYYTLPEEWGIDAQLVPNAGIAAKVAVFGLSVKTTERLLKKTPLKARGGPLALVDRPLSGAVYFNGESFIKALRPWLELGVDTALKFRGEEQNRAGIMKQVNDALDVLSVFRGYSSATY